MRVLDVGCAFGYGSAAIIARGPAQRVIVGIERDPELLERARHAFPWLEMIAGDATALPVADGCADAVLLLDVIEHITEPERVLAEAHRVLRPGGVVVVTVPHRGPTRGLDALNVYAALRRRYPSWPELEGVLATDEDEHRHFTAEELRELLAPWFTVDRVARTGVGLQELVHLAILTVRVPLRAPRVARLLMPFHLIAYIVDDLLPTGPFAYHLAVRAHGDRAGGERRGAEDANGASAPTHADGNGSSAGTDAIERNQS
jgi:SAM-dependent methyltransferase